GVGQYHLADSGRRGTATGSDLLRFDSHLTGLAGPPGGDRGLSHLRKPSSDAGGEKRQRHPREPAFRLPPVRLPVPQGNGGSGHVGVRRILYVLALLAGCAQAQFLGYVSNQSTAQVVFTNQAANAASAILTNIGQSAHFLSYCNTGFGGTISLEASPDGTFTSPIVLASATYGQNSVFDSSCHVLQAGGYFQTVRARITNRTAGSVNAWYTAIGSPVSVTPAAFGSNGPTSPIAC